MKVKKYVAPTMPEAMSIVRKELGPDAVILNSKEIQEGGFLGFFKKRKIEVVAALDKNPMPEKAKKHAAVAPRKIIKESAAQPDKSSADILDEIKYLKKIMQQQVDNKEYEFDVDYQVVFQHLVDQEVDDELAERIIKEVIENPSYPSSSGSEIIKAVRSEIEVQLSKLSFNGITYDKRIVQFVGPTGVGKTTTLAKVAAHSMLKDKKKVAFITMDTYRIAAIEQLKTYAKILDVPVEVAYSIEEYKEKVDQFKDYDLILVDTAGRNFRDEKYVKELQENINISDNVETFLVLALTAKPNDIVDIYNSFYHIPINEVIFTKADETRQYGSILNIALTKQVGVAYLTNGQDVPDDLIQPTPEKISNYIVGEFIDA
ncbi:flagellar biosynthesis protein FlhF [Oceanobacillus limi]|uniref:Flagellar biosynthesis protein FlhF n=1 Tax=Oceanobacillus limi TaxID=930131 RepID=A0A1H9Z2N2_9BACI|nr:flagellar biosynthesis protein FlhF [Oceanobacillus limi]SES75611.1 flagellar biosynthesis protein FlhF [Oceanobacillus limi]